MRGGRGEASVPDVGFCLGMPVSIEFDCNMGEIISASEVLL